MVYRSLIVQWFSVGCVGLTGLLINILLARTLGSDTFGMYSIATSCGAIVAIALNGGFGTLLQRERTFATQELRVFLPVLPRIALGHLLISTGVCSVLAVWMMPEHALLSVLVICFFAAMVGTQFCSAVLRGDGQLIKDAVWQIVNRLLMAVCVATAILLNMTEPWHIFLAFGVGAVVFALITMRHLRIRPLWYFPPSIYLSSLPFVWLELAGAIHFRADVLLLEWLNVSKSEIGHYAAVYRLIDAVLLCLSPVLLLLFRKFRLESGTPQKMLSNMLSPLLIAWVIGCLAMVFFLFYSMPLITLVYGNGYTDAGHVLTILGCKLFFMLPNGVLTQAALALNQERWMLMSTSMAAVVNIVGNIFLIPSQGLAGAALMTVMSEGVLVCCVGIGLWQRFARP